MKKEIKPDGYWIKEKCQEEALKYKTRTEFSKKANGAYIKSIKKDWLEEICSHMITLGNRYKRCIYVFEFEDNYAYIGLTFDFNDRHNRHLSTKIGNKSAVLEHINETGSSYIYKQLTDYIPVDEAKKQEEIIKNEYKDNGWIILNKIKCGGTGGSPSKWNKENSLKEALKYQTRNELKKNCVGAYNSIISNGWRDEAFAHMVYKTKETGYWSKERCLEKALLCKSRSEFSRKYGSAYIRASKNGWLDEICAHLPSRNKVKIGHWNIKENCLEEAKKHKTMHDFIIASNGAYDAAVRNGWIDEFFPK